eukprot:363107-Chlamydomonas_euryale.AAC.9
MASSRWNVANFRLSSNVQRAGPSLPAKLLFNSSSLAVHAVVRNPAVVRTRASDGELLFSLCAANALSCPLALRDAASGALPVPVMVSACTDCPPQDDDSGFWKSGFAGTDVMQCRATAGRAGGSLAHPLPSPLNTPLTARLGCTASEDSTISCCPRSSMTSWRQGCVILRCGYRPAHGVRLVLGKRLKLCTCSASTHAPTFTYNKQNVGWQAAHLRQQQRVRAGRGSPPP